MQVEVSQRELDYIFILFFCVFFLNSHFDARFSYQSQSNWKGTTKVYCSPGVRPTLALRWVFCNKKLLFSSIIRAFNVLHVFCPTCHVGSQLWSGTRSGLTERLKACSRNVKNSFLQTHLYSPQKSDGWGTESPFVRVHHELWKSSNTWVIATNHIWHLGVAEIIRAKVIVYSCRTLTNL